jgi:hypothetical protein
VTTTGMSAPPMEEVMCRPRAPLDSTPVVRARVARVGSEVTQNAAVRGICIKSSEKSR